MSVKRLVARVLRCLAWYLDPRSEVQRAQDKYRASISAYAEAERELIDTVRTHE